MDFTDPANPVTSSVQTTGTATVVDSGSGAHATAHASQTNPWVAVIVGVTLALFVAVMAYQAWVLTRPTRAVAD